MYTMLKWKLQIEKKSFVYFIIYKQKVSCHDMINSDSEWKSFLWLTNKPDFSSELFSNLLIC